jgi:hypothetical protein
LNPNVNNQEVNHPISLDFRPRLGRAIRQGDRDQDDEGAQVIPPFRTSDRVFPILSHQAGRVHHLERFTLVLCTRQFEPAGLGCAQRRR